MNQELTLEHQDRSVVVQGRIDATPTLSWFLRKYKSKFEKSFDFSKIVVSSSAEGRFIRYIFPKCGAFEASISHIDIPAALSGLTNVFQKLNYNILLSRLSRSPGTPQPTGKSTFVAICEPASAVTSSDISPDYARSVAENIQEHLGTCNPSHQFSLNGDHVSLGSRVATVAYPYRHGITASIREISAQKELEPYLSNYKKFGSRTVFLSYQKTLNDTDNGRSLLSLLYKTIEEEKLTVYDGFGRPSPLSDSESPDARARMWMASACIFVASSLSAPVSKKRRKGGKEDDWLSESQLVEYGYFYGQAKPWTIVTRHGQEKNVKNFMIADRSFTTYRDLSITEYANELRSNLKATLRGWFPIPSFEGGR